MKTFIMAVAVMLTSSVSMADCSSGNCAVANIVRKSVTVTKEVVKAPVNVCRRVVSLPSVVRHRCRHRCR